MSILHDFFARSNRLILPCSCVCGGRFCYCCGQKECVWNDNDVTWNDQDQDDPAETRRHLHERSGHSTYEEVTWKSRVFICGFCNRRYRNWIYRCPDCDVLVCNRCWTDVKRFVRTV